MPQTTMLQVPSGKVCRVKKQAFGARGGMKWLRVVEKTAPKTGVVELDLYPGHYRLTYKNNGHLTSTEFQVK